MWRGADYGQVVPAVLHSLTQVLSHAVEQQYESLAHTDDSHEQPPQPGVLLLVQPGSVAAGQSDGQVALVSPLSQTPLPQLFVVPLQLLFA